MSALFLLEIGRDRMFSELDFEMGVAKTADASLGGGEIGEGDEKI